MMTPFITDMGEKLKMTDQHTGKVMELCRYGYWDDMGRGKPEVRECSDDLEYLKRKYNIPDENVVDMKKLKQKTRDRYQENSNMNEINKFRNIVRECISEINKDNDPKTRLKESLRNVVKDVLKEISSFDVRKKDGKEFDKDELTRQRKGGFVKADSLYYLNNAPKRIDLVNPKLVKELEKIVHAINSDWEVYWDDHKELNIDAKNLLHVRITPKYENNFDIFAMVKLVDRIRVISVTWEQVKDFVKANFADLENKTYADKSKEKSMANKVDQDKNKKSAGPKNDLIKNRFEDSENHKIKDAKKKDMDYNEPQVKRDEDMPDQPMKNVTEPFKDPEFKNRNITKTDRVKPTKHKNDKKLRVPDKKTSKFTKRSEN